MNKNYYGFAGGHHFGYPVSNKFFNRICECTLCRGIVSLEGSEQEAMFLFEFGHMIRLVEGLDKWDAKRIVNHLSFLAELVKSENAFTGAYDLLHGAIPNVGLNVMLPVVESLYRSRFVYAKAVLVDEVLLRGRRTEVTALTTNEFLPLETLERLYDFGGVEGALLANEAFPFQRKIEASFLNKVESVHRLTVFFDAALVRGFMKLYPNDFESKLSEWVQAIAFGCSSSALGLALMRSGEVGKRLSAEASALLFLSYGSETVEYDVEF